MIQARNDLAWARSEEGAPKDIPTLRVQLLFERTCLSLSDRGMVCCRPIGHTGRHKANGKIYVLEVW